MFFNFLCIEHSVKQRGTSYFDFFIGLIKLLQLTWFRYRIDSREQLFSLENAFEATLVKGATYPDFTWSLVQLFTFVSPISGSTLLTPLYLLRA
jgi:hypothetical protein